MWTLIIPAIAQLLDKLIPDPQAKAAAQLEFMRMQASGDLANLEAWKALALAQIDVNKADASSGNWFQAGWRPFIGWTCGGALFSQYILRPWVQWVCIVLGHPLPQLPGIDDHLWELLGGMLGLGGLRTIEKLKGAA